jgi:hypothetical protein
MDLMYLFHNLNIMPPEEGVLFEKGLELSLLSSAYKY